MSRITDSDERYEAIINAIVNQSVKAFKSHGPDSDQFRRLRDRLVRIAGDDDALSCYYERGWNRIASWVDQNRKHEEGCRGCGCQVDFEADWDGDDYWCPECVAKAAFDERCVMSWD